MSRCVKTSTKLHCKTHGLVQTYHRSVGKHMDFSEHYVDELKAREESKTEDMVVVV